MKLKHEIEQFLLTCQSESKAPKAMRAYRNVLFDFLKHLGDVELDELKVADVQQYIRNLFNRPEAMKRYGIVRNLIRWLYAQELIAKRMVVYAVPPRLSSMAGGDATGYRQALLLEGFPG